MNDQILAGDNSTESSSNNPDTGLQNGLSDETTASNGQANGATAPGGAPDSADIFKGIDPAKLPPELKQSYNQMLSDYRDKTTRLKETIKAEAEKATQAYREKASMYDQIAAQEPFVKRWNEYVEETKRQTGQPPQEGDPNIMALKSQLEEVTNKIQQRELSELTSAFSEATNEKGERLHPEFDALNEITLGAMDNNGHPDEYSLLRGCLELAPGNSPQERLANGYKTAKAVYDKIFEAGKKAGLGRVNQKIQNGSIPPTNSGGDILQTTDKKPRNAREAMEMARRGVVVSRD
jgi:hypothetical protein